jgi:hypothetical protein
MRRPFDAASLPYSLQTLWGGNNVTMVFKYSSSGRTINSDEIDPLPDNTYNRLTVSRWEDGASRRSQGFSPG